MQRQRAAGSAAPLDKKHGRSPRPERAARAGGGLRIIDPLSGFVVGRVRLAVMTYRLGRQVRDMDPDTRRRVFGDN